MKDKLETLFYYLKYRKSLGKTSIKEIEDSQQKHIKKHLDYVTSVIPFYKHFKGKSLKDFPIMTKKTFMDNFDSLNAIGITEADAIEFAIQAERTRDFKEKFNNITIGLSSGTSDRRGSFLVANHEKNIWAGYILAKIIPDSIVKKRRIAFFMRANSNLYESVGSKSIEFKFFDIYQDIEKHIQELNVFKPSILVAQPSVLLKLAQAIKEKRLEINPEKVISVAEVLEEKDKEIIKIAFKKDVIHQVYQCTEGCLGMTCEYGNLHLNEDIVHIEKEYLDDKRFIPIITDFTRKTQPIIRYRLNDILVKKDGVCKCGSNFFMLEKIEGREDDVFTFKNSDDKDIIVFPDFIRRCVLFAGEISEYRIIQELDLSISIYVSVDEEIKNNILNEFNKLAEDQKFILPKIEFKEYLYTGNKKLKRVERLK